MEHKYCVCCVDHSIWKFFFALCIRFFFFACYIVVEVLVVFFLSLFVCPVLSGRAYAHVSAIVLQLFFCRNFVFLISCVCVFLWSLKYAWSTKKQVHFPLSCTLNGSKFKSFCFYYFANRNEKKVRQ